MLPHNSDVNEVSVGQAHRQIESFYLVFLEEGEVFDQLDHLLPGVGCHL